MKKIIVLYNMQYTLRDIHRFGVDYLMNKGYDVELWSVYEKGTRIREFICSSGYYEGNNYLKLEEEEFENSLEKNEEAVYLSYIAPTSDLMYYLLKSGNKYFMFWGLGLIYIESKEENKNNNIFCRYCKLIEKEGIVGFYRYIGNVLKYVKKEKVYKKLLRENPPQNIIMATPQGISGMPIMYRDKRYKFIHAQNYDRYLELRDKEDEELHITYIDSGYGFEDFDSAYVGKEHPFKGKENEYFQQLEALFVSLETQYNLPIVIAGHPHVKYNTNAFGGRKIYYNVTAEMVKKSKLVVMVQGTSFDFVLLFKKDILAISNDFFKKLPEWDTYFDANYKLFDITPCNLSDGNAISNLNRYIKTIDDEKREVYIEKYIKSKNSEDRAIIEIVEEMLLTMNQE